MREGTGVAGRSMAIHMAIGHESIAVAQGTRPRNDRPVGATASDEALAGWTDSSKITSMDAETIIKY